MNIYDDKELREAMIKRALGYEVEEKEIILDKNGKNTGKIKITKKHVPPSITALKAIQGLMNTRRWDNTKNND